MSDHKRDMALFKREAVQCSQQDIDEVEAEQKLKDWTLIGKVRSVEMGAAPGFEKRARDNEEEGRRDQDDCKIYGCEKSHDLLGISWISSKLSAKKRSSSLYRSIIS